MDQMPQQLIESFPASGLRPSDILRALDPSGPAAIWETSERNNVGEFQAHRSPRYSTVAVRPRKILSLSSDTAQLIEQNNVRSIAFIDPIELIRTVFAGDLKTIAAEKNNLPFSGGLLGFLSYDFSTHLERVRGQTSDSIVPEALFMLTGSLLVFDHQADILHVVSAPLASTQAEKDFRQLVADVSRLVKNQPERGPAEISSSIAVTEKLGRKEFSDLVTRAKEYIASGDAFQIVLGNSFESSAEVDPLALYDHLRAANPSPFHFLFRFGSHHLVGASPEVFLRGSTNGRISMRLVAGTYPKQNANSLDQLAAELRGDSKERAEHLMLVDHARNDLGRVAKIGSVEVEDLFSVETYADVHHLVSQVSASVAPEKDIFSAIAACFPIATLTGTPKIRAMEIIAELEAKPRGLFGGSVMALGYDGLLDSAVIIRSALVSPTSLQIQAGAGIVWDSVPEREYEECGWKAKAVLDAARKSCRPQTDKRQTLGGDIKP